MRSGPMLCGRCSTGMFADVRRFYYECTECGHRLTPRDIVLDPGESTYLVHSRLYIQYSESYLPEATDGE